MRKNYFEVKRCKLELYGNSDILERSWIIQEGGMEDVMKLSKETLAKLL